MNDVDLAKNILLNHTCEYCAYLKIMNKLTLCINGNNDRSTTLINSCEKFKICKATSFEDINILLNDLVKSLGIPEGYLIGRQ